MDSWYSALRARPFSTCCPTLRTTRATRRARAAPRVQSSLTCTGIARCTTHNASQRARENAPLVLLSSALRSSGATRARSLCFLPKVLRSLLINQSMICQVSSISTTNNVAARSQQKLITLMITLSRHYKRDGRTSIYIYRRGKNVALEEFEYAPES